MAFDSVSVCFTGILWEDPTLQVSNTGVTYAKARVGVHQIGSNKVAGKKFNADVTVFGPDASRFVENVHARDNIAVAGKDVELRAYINKEGLPVAAMSVVAVSYRPFPAGGSTYVAPTEDVGDSDLPEFLQDDPKPVTEVKTRPKRAAKAE